MLQRGRFPDSPNPPEDAGGMDWRRIGRALLRFRWVVLLMVALGLADQRCKPEAADPSTRSRDWEGLRAFGAEINHRAGADARHFQLPHLGYPEAIAPGSMGSYDHLAAVLARARPDLPEGYRLVIAGMVDHKSEPYYLDLKRRAEAVGGVEFVVGPPDTEMQRLYDECPLE